MNKLSIFLFVVSLIGSTFQGYYRECIRNQCSKTPGLNLVCNNATNMCECKAGYMALLDKQSVVSFYADQYYCVKSIPAQPNSRTLRETCKKNADCQTKSNLKCMNGICDCGNGTKWIEFRDRSKNYCGTSRPNNTASFYFTCFHDEDCMKDQNLKCENNLCVCKPGLNAVYDKTKDLNFCKQPLPNSISIYNQCLKTSDCIQNGECIDGFCYCKTGYINKLLTNFTDIITYMHTGCQVKENKTIPNNSRTYRQYCERNEHCKQSENLVCSYKNCGCKTGYRQSFIVTNIKNVLYSKPICKLYQPATKNSRSFLEYCDKSDDCSKNQVCQGLGSKLCFCHKNYQKLAYNKYTKKYDCL